VKKVHDNESYLTTNWGVVKNTCTLFKMLNHSVSFSSHVQILLQQRKWVQVFKF